MIMADMNNVQILTGDSLTVLPTLAAESVQCCVTSPPYWGLRDYDHPAQIGAEPSPELYVENLVATFREVRRVLCRMERCDSMSVMAMRETVGLVIAVRMP
jgi:DNA modification methylase